MKTILIFVIQGYEQKMEDGSLVDNCTLELIDKTPEEALERAKKMVKKSFYRIAQIIEKEII